jgi:CubicO group peptidase (beta-lactamase class C family)
MTWDETLGGRLDGVVAMHPDWADTTLSQLLTHTSGVGQPPLSMMMNSVTEPVRLREIRRELAAKVLEEPPATPPGTAFSYSNVGYTLASIMAEEATGETWETLVKTRLAGPLGLDTLGFGAPVDGGDNQSVPWGHTRVGPIHMSMNPAETTDNPRWMAAAGTLHISLQELLDYGRAHLEAGRGDDALLSPEMFDYLHTPVMDEYGHGWVVQTRDFADDGTEETVIWHNGTNTMWYAVLLIVPRRDAVIALVTNDGAGYAGTQARFDQLAKEILLELPVKAP